MGLVCFLLDSAFLLLCACLPEQYLLNYYLREVKGILFRMSLAVESFKSPLLSTKLEMGTEGNVFDKIGVLSSWKLIILFKKS